MVYMTRTHGFYSICTNIQWNNCHFPTELVQTKLHVGTLCFDHHHQSFWQLIDRSIQCVLTYLSPTVDKHMFQLVSVWNFATIHHLLQCSPICFSRTERRHIVHATLLLTCAQMCQSGLNWKTGRQTARILIRLTMQFGGHCSRWCIVAKFHTLTSWNVCLSTVSTAKPGHIE